MERLRKNDPDAPKKVYTPADRLLLLKTFIRSMKKMRDATKRIELRHRLAMQDQTHLIAVFQRRCAFVITDRLCRKEQKTIYLRVNIKVNGDSSILQLEAYDLNPRKRDKFVVKPFETAITDRILDLVSQNMWYIEE